MSYNATENSASRRIATLLDEGSFVEIGGAVTARSTTFNLQEKAAPSDGVITGYGVIDGNLVYVYSQDADVLGGALGEMHAKKIARIYDMAMKMGAPVIGLIDCAGLRLQEATDALEAFGSLYHKQALASGVIPENNEDNDSFKECTDDLNRICADIANASEDTAIALAQIADNQILVETKKDYAKEMVTGFIRLNGMTVGVVANRSKVYNAEAAVEAEFDSVLTVDGWKSEKNMASAVAKLTYAFANATVPKVNVIVGKAFGSAYVSMNSKSIGADLVYAWPTAEIGMMDAKLAAQIMYADADAETLNEKAAEYKELQSSPNSAAARGYVDAIIEPADTRKYVIGAFEMLFTKREDRPAKKHGTV